MFEGHDFYGGVRKVSGAAFGSFGVKVVMDLRIMQLLPFD